MSEAAQPRRVLHLIIDGFPAERLAELSASVTSANETIEIFSLTEANTGEALQKIFASDAVAVWGQV